MAQGLLSDTVVLDSTRVLVNPYCGMLLANIGVTVTKVEMIGKGNDSRAYGSSAGEESYYYMGLNRRKKECILSLKTGEGRVIFLKTVRKTGILIENYRPGTMKKLHLGHDELREVNPGLIYGAVSGFSYAGPYSKHVGHDIID